MSKTNGKLKYDLALSTTSVYDASSIYINKSAELDINGNARLQYITVGPTYSVNNFIGDTPVPQGALEEGKSYVYIRNLGPAGAAPLHIAKAPGAEDNTPRVPNTGLPKQADEGMLMSLNVGEFCFLPLLTENKSGLQFRSGFIAGSTFWAGATHNDIEYMVCQTKHYDGPDFNMGG